MIWTPPMLAHPSPRPVGAMALGIGMAIDLAILIGALIYSLCQRRPKP